ncbi:hypothetical protein SUDANB58_02571 [Streptomyces sp. enrichment culture]
MVIGDVTRVVPLFLVKTVCSVLLVILVVLVASWLQDLFTLKSARAAMPSITVGISAGATTALEVLWRGVGRRVPA